MADRLIQLIAPDAYRPRYDDRAERDHGDLARSAADVEHHAPDGLLDRDTGADRRRDRLFDQMHTPRARAECRLLDGTLLDLGDARRRTHDHTRMRPPAVKRASNEIPQHLFGYRKVGDHPMTQRTRRGDRRRRAADHPLGLDTDRVDLARQRVDGNDGGLRRNDAPATDVHK